MNPELHSPESNLPRRILVAGDFCLDVVGVPLPPPASKTQAENWRLTGETRTYFLPGGALLLAEWVREAARPDGLCTVVGPQPMRPSAISEGGAGPLDTQAFLKLAPRLCRDEVVHSMLRLKCFPTKPGAKKNETTLRLDREAGFSGPTAEEPTLEIRYPGSDAASVVVLDDTGNRFRQGTSRNPWPAAISSPLAEVDARPLIIYKLHRPLPGTEVANPLWDQVVKHFPDRRIVIASVDDLRAAGVPISQGLSWERTALDVVWQLLNTTAFLPLRDCPWLIIRLGLDGAILWRCVPQGEKPVSYKAWLVYDPEGIEGSFALRVPGRMVGAGSVFTAAIVEHASRQDGLKEEPLPDGSTCPCRLISGIEAGLLAARRLFRFGYGGKIDEPAYLCAKLFGPPDKDDAGFSCQPIPIIPGALAPDRGGWRLLDQIFSGQTSLLHRAVMQLASNRKPAKVDENDKQTEAGREYEAHRLLKQVPLGEFGKLRTHDRGEMENYRSLHTLLRDYLGTTAPPRPLSFAVFGPPGAGKSFGVKEVAASLKGQPGCREVKDLTFNLSLYQTPEELAGAFHLVRDEVLEGKVPLVFFDEFDTALNCEPLGWLRHFLAPMQDGKFLDRGAPHPIGQAIFVFAGGTCDTYREFSAHPGMDATAFKQCKGPDFLSRLRATLDIPSLNLLTAFSPPDYPRRPNELPVQPPGTFDPFAPIESLPCEAAILLRRAAILSFNLKAKAPGLIRSDESLEVDPAVLRALLFLPAFNHGNRSFEALMDMSHLADIMSFSPSMLPAAFQLPLHADAKHFRQLLDVDYPFPRAVRELMAERIHQGYLNQQTPSTQSQSSKPWNQLSEELRESNRSQADDIASKLRSVGLWYRQRPSGHTEAASIAAGEKLLAPHVEGLARAEHDRWTAQKRRQGWIPGPDTADSSKNDSKRISHCLFQWEDLREDQKDLDRVPIRNIPGLLALAAYEVIKP
jgi:hypothetical protein